MSTQVDLERAWHGHVAPLTSGAVSVQVTFDTWEAGGTQEVKL